jgi:hypothetical protein
MDEFYEKYGLCNIEHAHSTEDLMARLNRLCPHCWFVWGYSRGELN